MKREVASTHTTSKASDDYSSDCDDDDDYMSESEEDDEPLDYTSDVASVKEPDMGDTEGFTSEPNDAPPNQLDMAVDEDGTRIDADDENAVNDEPMGAVEHLERRLSTDDHASDSGKSGSTDWNECQELEHLAGPRCEHASGYCGFNISAEEMRGCTTVQCLVVKTSEWTPEPDDQDFELTGKYFLSGLCGQMPSRDIGGPTMTPPRHGAEDIYPDTTVSGSIWRAIPLMAPELTRGLSFQRPMSQSHQYPSIQPASKYLLASPVCAPPALMLTVLWVGTYWNPTTPPIALFHAMKLSKNRASNGGIISRAVNGLLQTR